MASQIASSPAATSSSERSACSLSRASFGDREAVLVAQRDQRLGVGVREGVGVRGDLRVLALAADEPAADGVVRLGQKRRPLDGLGDRGVDRLARRADRRPGSVARAPVAGRRVAPAAERCRGDTRRSRRRHRQGQRPRVQRHRVRVAGQPRARLERDVGLGERHRVRPVERRACRPRASRATPSARHPDLPSRAPAPAGPRRPHRVCRARFRSRRGSRTARRSPGRPSEQPAGGAQTCGEVPRGAHGADRVRARGSHADGEQLERRDVRCHTLLSATPRADPIRTRFVKCRGRERREIPGVRACGLERDPAAPRRGRAPHVRLRRADRMPGYATAPRRAASGRFVRRAALRAAALLLDATAGQSGLS